MLFVVNLLKVLKSDGCCMKHVVKVSNGSSFYI
jgi:hypothetical protein